MANCVIAYDPCFSCAEKKCEICELDMHRKGVFQQSEGIANNATTTGKWISVDERLPEDVYGKERKKITVLVCSESGKVGTASRQRRFKFNSTKLYWEELDTFTWSNGKRVTHWMPLPEPPKMKGGAE